jgi:putative membrane protein
VLLAALAGHGVLAKYLYAYPPRGFPAGEAETGAYLMYYGGALVEAALITVFCGQEYAVPTGAARSCRRSVSSGCPAARLRHAVSSRSARSSKKQTSP